MNSKVPARIAFVHVMKTAGSFVDEHLTRELHPRGYRLFNSWTTIRRDWTLEELDGIRREAHAKAYVHNHAGGWDEAMVRRYQDSGWFVFSFARPPGDRWCSFFYWARACYIPASQSLDGFLHRAFSGKMTAQRYANLDIPEYWEKLDFIAPFSSAVFGDFLEHYFGVKFDAGSAPCVNESANPGYDKCLETGEISAATDRLIRASRQFEIYETIRARGVPALISPPQDVEPGLL